MLYKLSTNAESKLDRQPFFTTNVVVLSAFVHDGHVILRVFNTKH